MIFIANIPQVPLATYMLIMVSELKNCATANHATPTRNL
jgi:hypothetical protein